MFRTPWEADPPPAAVAAPLPPVVADPKPRGRRPAPSRQGPAPARPAWLYHHLTITGPAAAAWDFAAAARGPGVTPWRIDGAVLEEDVFNLAVGQPPARRALDVAGCRILARQFRDRVEARQARAVALVGRGRGGAASQACPFDLHTLLPVPDAILRQGPTHPAALAWLAAHWGVGDGLRHVAARPDPRPGRRLPRDHAVIGYGFFTGGDTPDAAIARLAPRWPALRLALQPRPD